MRSIIIFVVAISLLMGCQHSPKKNYYLLTAAESESAPSTEPVTRLIGIGPIEIADYLHRLHIVYHTNDNRLFMTDNDYWGESLPKGIARVMALNLAQYDRSRGFVEFPWRNDSRPSHSVRININQFSRANDKVSINATWELMDNTTRERLEHRHFIQSTSVSSGSAALTEGYSKLLAELAQQINEELKQIP